MFRSNTRLWLLPDLGTDSRLLKPQADYFSNFGPPPLCEHVGCHDLADFAKRSVDQWLAKDSTERLSKHRFYLGGIGFGGILALEMAIELSKRSLAPAGVLLINSARTRSQIPYSLRLKLAMLGRLPAMVGRWRLRNFFSNSVSDESMQAMHLRLLQKMVDDLDWTLFRWQAHALLTWNRQRSDFNALDFPIHQVHGRGDRSFRVPSVDDATLLIHGKSHINLVLCDEVNRWIESILRDHDLRQANIDTTR